MRNRKINNSLVSSGQHAGAFFLQRRKTFFHLGTIHKIVVREEEKHESYANKNHDGNRARVSFQHTSGIG